MYSNKCYAGPRKPKFNRDTISPASPKQKGKAMNKENTPTYESLTGEIHSSSEEIIKLSAGGLTSFKTNHFKRGFWLGLMIGALIPCVVLFFVNIVLGICCL